MNAPFARSAPDAPHPFAQMLPPLTERRDVRKAVILAAGRGRRMGKLTADRPKGALEVGGHALIDWQIEALRAAGVKDIAVVTGHGASALAGRDVEYIHNPDWATGTQVDTLLAAADWIGAEPAIVSYSDIIYHPCAPLALLERPGEIVIAYDADHRWLWKQRFGNWLRDSETFKLGPGQVLTEIGGKPKDIEEMDGQFMGLMLFSANGFEQLARRFREVSLPTRAKLDFTALLAALLGDGVRIDTAANLLPWIEIDSAKDLRIARSMTEKNSIKGTGSYLTFPTDFPTDFAANAPDYPTPLKAGSDVDAPPAPTQEIEPWVDEQPPPCDAVRDHIVENAIAIQNWGRSGSTLLQSLLDDHPQILSTPNFYSRYYYIAWAKTLARIPSNQRVDAFLRSFRHWWDTGLVDASAGLHRLGENKTEIAGVSLTKFGPILRKIIGDNEELTRRRLFEAAHIAYAIARGQRISGQGLQILFPVHGEPRGVAAALLEDFPNVKFVHTIRDPVANVVSQARHFCRNWLHQEEGPLIATINTLFLRSNIRHGCQITLFGERAYFSWLAINDQARALRVEDLHCDASATMFSLARWLHIDSECDQLLRSTWDGKKWWNRPETGVDSLLGGEQAMQASLAPAEKSGARRVMFLVRPNSTIDSAYPTARFRTLAKRLLFLPASAFWFGAQSLERPNLLQCLLGTSSVQWLIPRRLAREIANHISRERFRTRLMEMSAGAKDVRRKLSDSDKNGTLNAKLMLIPKRSGWTVRAVVSINLKQTPPIDRISVHFIDDKDDASNPISIHLFWIFVLIFGGFAAMLRSRLTLWRITFFGAFASRRDIGRSLNLI